MKLKFVWKLLRKPKKQVQRCCRAVAQFLHQIYDVEMGEQNENDQLEIGEEHFVEEILPIDEEDETRMAAVISNEYEQTQNGLMLINQEELYQEMASILDAIFRRHFLRNADQFALANVESMHCARKRQRQFQLIKELLAEMIEHWEEAQHKRQCRQFGGSNQWMNDIGVRLFMDTFFGTFWDFLMKCSQTLEWAFPHRDLPKENVCAVKSAGNKNGKRNRHSIYGPLTSTMISDEKEVEKNKAKIPDFNLEFDDILLGSSMETMENVAGNGIKKNICTNQIKGQMKEGRNKGERPKSAAAIYLF